jgi:hypothetical protein
LPPAIRAACCHRPGHDRHDRVKGGSRLEPERWVGIFAKRARPRPHDCRVQEPYVPRRSDPEAAHETERILDRLVLDAAHTEPRRLRTSPQRSIIRSVLWATFLA